VWVWVWVWVWVGGVVLCCVVLCCVVWRLLPPASLTCTRAGHAGWDDPSCCPKLGMQP
jgi:hypothetical protein